MKAALYARVSTEEQAQKDNSIPAQLRLLKEYCQKNGIEIQGEYADEGVTGQKEERPQFQRMLAAAKDGLIDIILVHKFDRFARKIELSRNIKSNLKSANVNVISITEPIEDSPMGFFMEGLYELMAEYYVKNLAVEVKKGMNERALKGKHMGQMPFGYYCSGGNVYVNEDQAAIIHKVFEHYKNGWGHMKIAKWLNFTSVPTFKGLLGSWQSFQVKQMLSNPKYIGKNYWDGNYYDAEFPAIIDVDLFEETAKRMKLQTEAHTYRGNNYEKYYLLGLLFCGECGSIFRIKPNHNRNGTKTDCYICRDASLYRGDCKLNKLFPAVRLENEIDRYIKAVLSDASISLKIEPEKHVDSLGIIQKGIEKIENELNRAKKAYVGGVFDLDEYRELREELEEKKMDLEKEINTNSAEIDEEKRREILIDNIKNAWSLYENAETANDKRLILQRFIKKILVYRDRFEIIFLI
ncbi:MAG: recombinase family protein [Anaerotignum sp.]|nr:recombinase family protein [Anaerotignum sp.]